MQSPANDGVASDPGPLVDPAELKAREEWFTVTPDPWAEIAVWTHGQDRTAASTLNRLVVQAERAQWPALEHKLLLVLGRAELTDAARQFVCRMLALIGSAESLPPLAALLSDVRTSDDARLALDEIADPQVDTIYLQALSRLHGRAKLGLIGSIATRRNRHAVDALTAMAIDPAEPAEVRAAAESAVKWLLDQPTP